MGRLFLWFVSALIALVLISSIVLKLFINPNDYREQLAELVEAATGRTFTIEGDLSLQIFPTLGVQLGPLELSNPEGFESSRMLRVEKATVSVQLLPLIFKQQLAIGMVSLDKLDMSLLSYADGRSNLVFGETPAQPKAGSAPSDVENGADDEAELLLGIAGVSITDGRIYYLDEQSGDDIQITDLSLQTSAIANDLPFDAELALSVSGLAPATTVDLQLSSAATVNFSAAELDLAGVSANLHVQGPDVPGGQAKFDIAIGALRDIAGDTMTLEELTATISVAGLRLLVTAAGVVEGSVPALSGALEVGTFSPQAVLTTIGQPALMTADPKVLQTAALTSSWSLTGDKAELDKLLFGLDDTNAQGRIALTSIERESIEFDLQVTSLNIDRYTEPAAGEPVTRGASAADDSGSQLSDSLDLPMQQLRALDMQGRLRFRELRAADALLQSVDVSIRAKDGLIRLHPLTADVYEGTYSDDIVLDVRKQVPNVSLQTDLQGFQVGRFLADTQDFANLVGLANMQLSLKTRGKTERALTRNLNGTASFALEDGRYVGKDLWYEIRAAKDKVKGDTPPRPPADPYTDISEFSGSARIEDGIVRNRDFAALVPFLSVAGGGKLNLMKSELDYRLEAKVTGAKKFSDGYTMDDLDGVSIPVKLRGNIAEPQVSIGIEEILSVLAKKKAEERLMKKLGLDENNKGKKAKGKKKSSDSKEKLEQGLRDLLR